MNGNNPDYNRKVSQAEKRLEKFRQGWTDFMLDIWQNKMMQMQINDTGALLHSVQGDISDGTQHVITHKFLLYGIYVAAGTGNGYRHGNSGRDDDNGLQFLRGGRYYTGKHRKRRDWFASSYLYSLHRLNEKEAEAFGDEYQGLMSTALDDLFDRHGVLRSL